MVIGAKVLYEIRGLVSDRSPFIGDVKVEESSTQFELRPETNVAKIHEGDVRTTNHADLDGSGEVDFADFLVIAANFGRNDEAVQLSDGDLNGDGAVAFSDFLILSQQFG